MLQALSCLGLVWDLHVPPRALVKGKHRLGRTVIEKVAAQLAASFPINTIATQVLVAQTRSPDWAQLQARVLSTRAPAEAFWAEIDMAQLPTLSDVQAYASTRLPQTLSLDEIAICARQRMLELVYARLVATQATISMPSSKTLELVNG